VTLPSPPARTPSASSRFSRLQFLDSILYYYPVAGAHCTLASSESVNKSSSMDLRLCSQNDGAVGRTYEETSISAVGLGIFFFFLNYLQDPHEKFLFYVP